MALKIQVHVIERETDEVVDRIDCQSMGEAMRVQKGVNINLHHGDYYTDIKSVREDGTNV